MNIAAVFGDKRNSNLVSIIYKVKLIITISAQLVPAMHSYTVSLAGGKMASASGKGSLIFFQH